MRARRAELEKIAKLLEEASRKLREVEVSVELAWAQHFARKGKAELDMAMRALKDVIDGTGHDE